MSERELSAQEVRRAANDLDRRLGDSMDGAGDLFTSKRLLWVFVIVLIAAVIFLFGWRFVLCEAFYMHARFITCPLDGRLAH